MTRPCGTATVWTLALAAALPTLALAGCDDQCEGPACVGGDVDGGPGDGGATVDAPVQVDAGPPSCELEDAGIEAACDPWEDANGCVEAGTCPDPTTVRLELRPVATVRTDEGDNPEIVDFIPGSPERALVIAAVSNEIVELVYSDTSLAIGRSVRLDLGGTERGVLSSVEAAPSGDFAAVTAVFLNCAIGQVLFVDIRPDTFGTLLGRVEVGFNPDSGAFTDDGRYFVTADEDDREDRPCKPADRFGGSVSIVDLAPETADGEAPVLAPRCPERVLQIPVDHAADSEPEGIAIGPGGLAALTIQESSEVAIFDVLEAAAFAGADPRTLTEIFSVPADPEPGLPDGIDISPDGRWLGVGLEETDRFLIYDAATRTLVTEYWIAGTTDVPLEWNRDATGLTKVHEVEQLKFMRSEGALFVLVTLQESHGVMAYRVADDGTVALDSASLAGTGWLDELNGRDRSNIRPEGLAVNERAGLVLSAQEAEGSITLHRTAAMRYVGCP